MDTKEEDMKAAFNLFDQDGDGFITVEELKSVMSSLGLKQGKTLEGCKKMIIKWMLMVMAESITKRWV